MKKVCIALVIVLYSTTALASPTFAEGSEYNFLIDLARKASDLDVDMTSVAHAHLNIGNVDSMSTICVDELTDVTSEMDHDFGELSDLAVILNQMKVTSDKAVILKALKVRAKGADTILGNLRDNVNLLAGRCNDPVVAEKTEVLLNFIEDARPRVESLLSN